MYPPYRYRPARVEPPGEGKPEVKRDLDREVNVSTSKTNKSSGNGHGLRDRAQGVVVLAVPAGQRARDGLLSATKSGMLHARIWTAPRLEDFASVVETKITPAVASSLRSSAKRVQPPRESRMRAMLSLRGLIVLFALLGAAGAAAGIAMRKRYSTATAEAEMTSTDSTTTVVPEPTGERMAPDDYRIGSGSNW
jgi:hypothetical protein